MKINRNKLKELILQEFNAMVSTQDQPFVMQDYFFTSPFQSEVKGIIDSIKDLGDMIRDGKSLERKDLLFLRNDMLDRIATAVNFVDGVIESKIKAPDEDSE